MNLREQFFEKYGIKGKPSHEKCKYYAEIKGHKLCQSAKDGELLNSCPYVQKVYPEITQDILIKLICVASGLFLVQFAAERDIYDIEDDLLKQLIAFNDIGKQGEIGVKRTFGYRAEILSNF